MKNVELTISNTLKDLGMSPRLLGFNYLKEAIKLTLKDESMVHRMTKVLYPTVAQTFGSKSSRVERAMRHSIESGWHHANIDFQKDVFGYTVSADRGKPTNAEFIATVVEYLKSWEMV